MSFKIPIYFLLALLVTQQTFGQTNVKDSIRTAADLKTGNSQDVLISFFQLAFDDITSDKKSLKFQSSLFAIKAKTDSDLWIDINYLKEKFSRNLVLSISPTFDSSYKFKSNTFAFKYAIVNNRDKTVFDFSMPTDMIFEKLKKAILEEYATSFSDGTRNTNYRLALNFFIDEEEEGRTPIDKLPEDFKQLLKSKSQKTIFQKFTPDQFRNYLRDQYRSLAKYVENRGLLTVEGAFSSFNNGRLFSGINLNSQYLKGLIPENKKTNIELNIKASLDFSDDTANVKLNDLNRQVFNFSGGFNWIILRNSRSKSLLEFKGAVSYFNVLKGGYAGETKNLFAGEGTIRLRITNDIWLPVQINYNPKNGDVFGFLSVRSNFDWLK